METARMRALVFERSLAKYAAAMVAGRVSAGGGARVGPLSLQEVDRRSLPGPGWREVRPLLSGICGSDLATIDGHSSRYFEPIVSFPFTPGHEVVGETDDGRRVALMATLPCAGRGVDPPCQMCAGGRTNLCERQAFGHVAPGLQTGFCQDTGGGWSTGLVAHQSQLFDVPDDLADEDAVLIEPVACAVHAARSAVDASVDAAVDASVDAAPARDTAEFAVIGAGMLGLATLAALRHLADPPTVLAAAKYAHQKLLARELGALLVAPDDLDRAARRHTGSLVAGSQLTGGIGHVIDCVGSAESIAQALRIVQPGGSITMVGMPGHTSVDLTPLWHREVAVKGSYAYTADDFATAIDVIRAFGLGRLLSAAYPLDRYREAIDHAAHAGRRGAVRIAFDLRPERRR
jgi:threonine dehydrogenase-like Zn-dependent dehydrogenase